MDTLSLTLGHADLMFGTRIAYTYMSQDRDGVCRITHH